MREILTVNKTMHSKNLFLIRTYFIISLELLIYISITPVVECVYTILKFLAATGNIASNIDVYYHI